MTEFITLLIAIHVIYYVASPLFERRYRFSLPPLSNGKGHSDELSHLKYEAFSAIKDLELEYETGELSRDDYESMRREHEVRAIRVHGNTDLRCKAKKALK